MRFADCVQNRKFLALVLGVITLLGVLTVFSMPLHADADWLLLVAQRMMEGDVYGVDIFELNPPLSAYLHFPPVWVAHFFSFPVNIAFISYVLVFLLCCVGVCWKLLQYSALKSWQRDLMLVGIVFALLIVPHAEIVIHQVTQKFGEREHFILAALFPYILLTWLRVAQCKIPLWLQSICGILLGFTICLKPHFALVPLFLEVYVCWKMRQWRKIFNVVTILTGMSVVGYVLFVWSYHQGYLPVIKLTLETYAAWGAPWEVKKIMFIPVVPMLLCFGVWLDYSRTSSSPHSLLPIVALAITGMYGAGIVQGKGFPYHFLPFAGGVVFIATVWISALIEDAQRYVATDSARRLRGTSLFRPTAVFIFTVPLAGVMGFLLDLDKPVLEGRVVQEYLAEQPLKPKAAGVLSLENQYFPNTSGVRYAGRFMHLLPLGAEVLDISEARKAEIRAFVFSTLNQDFKRWNPEVVFVEPKFLQFVLSNNATFAKTWERYRYVKNLQDDSVTLEVYQLSQ